MGAHPLDNFYLSEVTLAEIRFDIEKLPDALKQSVTIVTRDTGDFALTRVAVLNPWLASAAE